MLPVGAGGRGREPEQRVAALVRRAARRASARARLSAGQRLRTCGDARSAPGRTRRRIPCRSTANSNHRATPPAVVDPAEHVAEDDVAARGRAGVERSGTARCARDARDARPVARASAGARRACRRKPGSRFRILGNVRLRRASAPRPSRPMASRSSARCCGVRVAARPGDSTRYRPPSMTVRARFFVDIRALLPPTGRRPSWRDRAGSAAPAFVSVPGSRRGARGETPRRARSASRLSSSFSAVNHSRAQASPASSTLVITTPSSRGSRTSLRRRKFTSSRISSCNRTVRVPSPTSRCSRSRSRSPCFCLFHLPIGTHVPCRPEERTRSAGHTSSRG